MAMLCTTCGAQRPDSSFWSVDLARYVARCSVCRAGSDWREHDAAPQKPPKPKPPSPPLPVTPKITPKPPAPAAREPEPVFRPNPPAVPARVLVDTVWHDERSNFRVIPDAAYAALLAWTFENNSFNQRGTP